MVEPRFDAVRSAIRLEQESYQIYSAIEEKSADPNTKMLCRTLAEEELRHERMLQELGTQDLANLNERLQKLGAFDLQFIDNMEGPYDSYELENMLKFALKLEVEASMRYRVFADGSSGEIRKLFSDLADMEEKHTEMLRREMVRLEFRKKWSG